MTNHFLEAISWPKDGLIPAIAQDEQTGEVLMLAWMNREALALTVAEQQAVYWSRSRRQLWRKGEQSGHVQHIRAIQLDCDGDAIVLVVKQEGGIACHTGHRHCFFRELQPDGHWQVTGSVLKTPTSIYGQSS